MNMTHPDILKMEKFGTLDLDEWIDTEDYKSQHKMDEEMDRREAELFE